MKAIRLFLPAGSNFIPDLSELVILSQLVILTEADWQRFSKTFDRVFPHFIVWLRQAYPTLTPAEIRIICLSQLRLSTREMADRLGVSPGTIVKTRYRIRKKIGLAKGEALLGALR